MTLIVAGLASAGAIGTALGLAVLLGADVGSAIVSAVFASGSTVALWASPDPDLPASSCIRRPPSSARIIWAASSSGWG
jgi:hypothetical protein